MTSITTFDPTGTLPSGRAVLEASAGTGKTWTIAALTARYVAEEAIPIDQILVVTFTRAATSELRERVRARLIEAARFLRNTNGETTDSVLAHLADTDKAERTRRAARLQLAIAGFDRATITTLHGFAHRLLREFGFLSATPRSLDVGADRGDLVDQAITDLVVQRYAQGHEPAPRLKDLWEIAAAVLTNPDAGLVPRPEEVAGWASARSAFAHHLRDSIAERSEAAGIVTYDDLLIRARNALTAPAVASLTRQMIRGRYQVALIDEFQDTDRIQWDIVDALFPAKDTTLIIIGDPKQSIYAFRGADVAAYLTAAAASTLEHTLSTNWRSDGPLIAGLDALFDGVAFGDVRIPYRPVTHAPGRAGSRIRGVDAPLAVRMVGRASPVRTNRDSTLSVPAARLFIAEDAASYIVELIGGQVEIDDGGWRPVRPGDIAVLCRTGHEVALVKEALAYRRVPAVVGRTGSVLSSEAAEHWLTLLAALEFPSSTRRVRAAALTPFVGWTPAQLLAATDDDLLPLHDQVTTWSQLLESSGVPALSKAIEQATRVSERVLGVPGGERLATDLDHLTEVLHSAHRSGARSLHDWLVSEMQRAAEEAEDGQVQARRLETDADAVHVLTIHGAKGLEFPVVLCPYLWNAVQRSPAVPVYHPPGTNHRMIDVGGAQDWEGFDEAQRIAEAEGAAEEMRLMYVALTRARHHVAVWWAMCGSAKTALLSRLLFGRAEGGSPISEQVALVSDDRLISHLQPVIRRSKNTIGLTQLAGHPPTDPWLPTAAPPTALSQASFDRRIDFAWRRTSFSGITADRHRPSSTPDPSAAAKTDEPQPDPDGGPDIVGDLPMSGFRGGTRFGTLVHNVLEHIDFTAADLETEIADACQAETSRSGMDVDEAQLTHALYGVMATPLFPATNSPRLRDIPRSDRLAEMEFEMSVLAPGSPVGVGSIAEVLRRHLGSDHPLLPYADRLAGMDSGKFRGHLTGAIDLVARLGTPQRYWVIDYKTNRLDPPGDTAAIGNYSPPRLAHAMVEGDYVLQSILYQVALHRYLRFRIPDYDVTRHLGGSLYLFVRGMIGPDTPTTDKSRYGVAAWPANSPLIIDLSELFDRGPQP